MKRRLQLLALCVAVLAAVHLMAQETGGGGDAGGGAGGGGAGGGSLGTGDAGGGAGGGAGGATENGAGGTGGEGGGGNSNTPSQGEQGAGGTSNTPGEGGNGTGTGTGNGASGIPDIFSNGAGGGGTENGEGAPSTLVPAPEASPPPEGVLTPGATQPAGTPAPSPGAAAQGAGAQGPQAAPVTLTLPGGYGGASSTSFTLGQGRLAKPPITFTVSVSTGYDDNVFSADSHPVPNPTPFPTPTPPLFRRLIGFRILPPAPETPIYGFYRPKFPSLSGSAIPQQLGVIGSPVSTASLGVQIQKGSPRTVITGDLTVTLSDYWNRPGTTTDYSGSADLTYLHRITSRMSVSLTVSGVYQKTPNFALINAPTNNNNGGSYLNGTAKLDLSYSWTKRLSTVTSLGLNTNLLESNTANNLFAVTYGNQFRYTVSARNTATAEIRQTETDYSTNSGANSTDTFYLLGLDTLISTKLRNTFGFGIEAEEFSGGGGQTLPYGESATTLMLPRGGSLEWTNRYGSEDSGSPTQTIKSYRTGLTLQEPLARKVVASVSLQYNYLTSTDSSSPAGSYTQTEVEVAGSVQYTVTPRLVLNLNYTYLDLISGQVNSSYQRNQIFLGGTYTFR